MFEMRASGCLGGFGFRVSLLLRKFGRMLEVNIANAPQQSRISHNASGADCRGTRAPLRNKKTH